MAKPLSSEEFARLLAIHNRWTAKAEAKLKRIPAARMYQRHKRTGLFMHLKPEVREIALAKFADSCIKHEAKLASLSGWPRRRFLGCLAASASAHAQHSGMLGGTKPASAGLGRWRKGLLARIGLRAHYRDRHKGEQLTAAVHPGHGAPLPAEMGHTNLEGI